MKFNNNGAESVYFDVWKGKAEGRSLYSSNVVGPGEWAEYDPPDKNAKYTVHVWVRGLRADIAAAEGGADNTFQFGLVPFS